MKHVFAIFIATMFWCTISAQCTINFNAFPPGEYGIIPDTVTNLTTAFVGLPYSEILQIRVDPDTTTQLGTFPIMHMSLDSVSGLPAGFTYGCNPISCIFPGGSNGCINVSGTATIGQETGGPQGNGDYPLRVFITATVEVFTIPTAFPAILTGYNLRINGTNSTAEPTSSLLSVTSPSPNPAGTSTEFQFLAPTFGPVDFKLFNTMGAEVSAQQLQADHGLNHFQMETARIPAGVYLYSFCMEGQVVSGRLLITH